MKKGRMEKAEELLDEYGAAFQQAENTADWEDKRSMGPTLTYHQIYEPVRELWQEFSTEISRQAEKGNPHAVKIAAAILVMKNPGQEAAFMNAWDEYQMTFNGRGGSGNISADNK